MATSKKIREQMLELCGSICDDDGLDAKEYHQTKSERKKSDEYKQLRLCEQVARTLSQVLCSSVEEAIRELVVCSVVIKKKGAGLHVQLRRPSDWNAETCQYLLHLLKEQEGWLRCEVAKAITRKKVPRLAFEFIEIATDAECRLTKVAHERGAAVEQTDPEDAQFPRNELGGDA